MNPQDDPSPRFLSKSPLGEDIFPGKAQEKIAEAVAMQIKAQNLDGHLIGIDGPWGAGKSNLIKIIKNKLSASHHTFIYDAWGHQEDLQRRSFLEELTNDLCEFSLLDKKEWKQKLESLLSRHRTTTKRDSPRLSTGIVVTSLIAILTPIASAVSIEFEETAMKLLVAFGPAIIGISLYLGRWITTGTPVNFTDLYSLYKDREIETIVDEQISEQDPSVREFQTWMQQLSDSLKQKKLLIVFDNMDRLPPEKVRNLWSSIHTFFAEEKYDNIWVSIPFDYNHLRIAFDGDAETTTELINKSFSAVFRVPPLVLTDWKSFFKNKFSEAFPAEESQHSDEVLRIFKRYIPNPSPRAIISFINDLVALRVTNDNEIEISYLALFALTKTHFRENSIDAILAVTHTAKQARLFRDNAALIRQISAIVYHVPLELAFQISLAPEIESALSSGETEIFLRLSEHPYFFDLLESVVNEASEIDARTAGIALEAIQEAVELDDNASAVMRKCWDELVMLVLDEKTIKLDVGDGIANLIKNCSSEKRKMLLNAIGHELSNTPYRGDTYFEIANFVLSVAEKVQSGERFLKSLSPVEVKPDDFMRYLTAASAEYKKFPVECNEESLVEYGMSMVPDECDRMMPLHFCSSDFNFFPIVEKIRGIFKNDSLPFNTVFHVIQLYKALEKARPIDIISDSYLAELLADSEVAAESLPDLIAMALAHFEYSAFESIEAFANFDESSELVPLVANVIQDYTSYARLLEAVVCCDTEGDRQLIAVVNTIIRERKGKKLNVIEALKQFKTLRTALGVPPFELISDWGRWEFPGPEKLNAKNVAEIINDIGFFEVDSLFKLKFGEPACLLLAEHLQGLSSETWRTHFENTPCYHTRALEILLKGGTLSFVPDNAVVIYKENLLQFAKGEIELERGEFWQTVYDRTHKGKLKATAKNIRDIFLRDTNINSEFFLFFFDLLFNHGSLAEFSADSVRRIVTPIASDRACLEVIVNNEKLVIPLILSAADYADDFRDIIRKHASGLNPSTEVRTFAERIGIEF